MKPKVLVLTVVLLLMAMVPTFVMAKSQAKPEKMGRVRIDIRQPIGPQLDAQLGVSSRGPRSATMALKPMVSRGVGIQPNAVYGQTIDNFEPPMWPSSPEWIFAEWGLSYVGWDSSDYEARGGDYSLYSSGWPFNDPYYDNDMLSLAFRPMDLQGARRLRVRFYHMSDVEFGWDSFYWCGTADGIWFNCEYYTGSTNGKWRQVVLDTNKGDWALDGMLGSPWAAFGFIFESDSSITYRGTFVDQFFMRSWGPQPSN
ncbi:MAG TPA: hypothetical protein PK205_03980 [Promineifilum sp.]|nr:hypothetical protein [Promineifilum sp.]HRQ12444.1 hypothetical protein [Promineifilum sp.]